MRKYLYILNILNMKCGGEECTVNKIKRLESYLSEGLPRYQDVLEQQNRTMPEPPKEIEYRSPGIMESQIFTVLSKRFKSRKIKLFKIWCNMFSKDLCNKGTRRCCRNTTNKRRGIKGQFY